MQKLTNRGTRPLGFPTKTRKGEDGKPVEPVESVRMFQLAEGESADLPPWYVDELLKERGIVALLDAEQLRLGAPAAAKAERKSKSEKSESEKDPKNPT